MILDMPEYQSKNIYLKQQFYFDNFKLLFSYIFLRRLAIFESQFPKLCENATAGHPLSLISTFVVRCLDRMICILVISKVSS